MAPPIGILRTFFFFLEESFSLVQTMGSVTNKISSHFFVRETRCCFPQRGSGHIMSAVPKMLCELKTRPGETNRFRENRGEAKNCPPVEHLSHSSWTPVGGVGTTPSPGFTAWCREQTRECAGRPSRDGQQKPTQFQSCHPWETETLPCLLIKNKLSVLSL